MGTKELNKRLDRMAPDADAEAKRIEVMDRWFKEIAEYHEAKYGPAPPLTKAEQEDIDRFFDSLEAEVQARKLSKPAPPPFQATKVITG